MILPRDQALLEDIWENQGRPNLFELRILARLLRNRHHAIRIEAIGTYCMMLYPHQAISLTIKVTLKARRLKLFLRHYRRKWHRTRIATVRRFALKKNPARH
jgi:hypothetical protein